MAGNNEDSDKLDLEGLGALIGLGLLAYGVYKIFTSSDGTSNDGDSSRKKHLSGWIIEDIVNSSFRSFSDVDLITLGLYYTMPDVLAGKIKDDIYKRIMFERLSEIHNRILSLKEEYEGYYLPHRESELYDLISFIKNDCYEQIKTTRFITNLKGEILKKIPGFGVVGKFMNAKTEYYLLNSIKISLTEYFTCLYVWGKDPQEAKKVLARIYVERFKDYANQATDGFASAVSSIFR